MKRAIAIFSVVILSLVFFSSAFAQRGGSTKKGPVSSPLPAAKEDKRPSAPKEAPPDEGNKGEDIGQEGNSPQGPEENLSQEGEVLPSENLPPPQENNDIVEDGVQGELPVDDGVLPIGLNEDFYAGNETAYYTGKCEGVNGVDLAGIDNKPPKLKKEIIDQYQTKGIDLGNNMYLLCFKNDEPLFYEKPHVHLDIGTADESHKLIIYGLKMYMPSYPNNGEEYSRIKIGSNITLSALELSAGEKSLTTNPILISGTAESKVRSVKILDSIIPHNGIGTKIENAEDVQVSGTTITGKGLEVGTGILVADSSNIRIWDNIGTIENSNIGVDGAVDIKNTTFKGVKIPINNPGYEIDNAEVWKYTEKGAVSSIIGKVPLETCSAESSENGTVSMYLYVDSSNEYIYYGGCPIVKANKGEEGYYGAEDCLFGCTGLTNVDENHIISFSYNNDNVSYSHSAKTEISTLANGPSTGAGTVASTFEPGQHETKPPISNSPGAGNSDIKKAKGDGTDINFADGGGFGMKTGGCSLTGADSAGESILLLFTILVAAVSLFSVKRILVAVRIDRKKNRK